MSATLFQRVTSRTEESGKIAINLIRGLCSEIHHGRITFDAASEVMELSPSNKLDLLRILNSASNATSATSFSIAVFSFLALSEIGIEAYQYESFFWSAVEQEAAK